MTTDAEVTHISAETLREWLETHRPVTVVDIRGDDDRAQWAIPGSLHVNAYEALREGGPGRLASVDLPSDRPVVTVCSAGRLSETAAVVLGERGFDVRSLKGGMKAWSLAWNTASVPLARTTARVVQVRRTGKGCLSYIVGSDHEAVVIDPSVGTDVYVAVAREHGWSIRYVLETHVHADHLSRARNLVSETGAVLLLPPRNRVTLAVTPLADGEHVSFGSTTLTALHTPGHTTDSTTLVLNATALFTGDTLFTNGVGRPDLHVDRATVRARAADLFASLVRLRRLSTNLVVLPAHSSEPVAFDGRPIAAPLSEIGEWLDEWLASESSFVDRVTSRLPPTPPNFVRIAELNEAGEFPTGDPTELEAGANRCAVR